MLCAILSIAILYIVLPVSILIIKDVIASELSERGAVRHALRIRYPIECIDGVPLPAVVLEFYRTSPYALEVWLEARGIDKECYTIQSFLPLDKRIAMIKKKRVLKGVPFATNEYGDLYCICGNPGSEEVWLSGRRVANSLVNQSLADFLSSVTSTPEDEEH